MDQEILDAFASSNRKKMIDVVRALEFARAILGEQAATHHKLFNSTPGTLIEEDMAKRLYEMDCCIRYAHGLPPNLADEPSAEPVVEEEEPVPPETEDEIQS